MRIGIHGVLTGVQDQERIHFCAQIDVTAGIRIFSGKSHLPLSVDGNFAEEIDVCYQVHLAQSPFTKFDQELVVSISVKVIALVLVSRWSIFRPDQRRIGVAGEGIVPSTGVRRNGAKHVSHVAQENVPGG